MAEWPADLSREVSELAAAYHLRDAMVSRWRELDAIDARALLELAEALRVGENHLRDLLEWSEEIALREATTIAAVIRSEAVQAGLGRDRGRNDAVKAVREALRLRRFPLLVEAERRLRQCVRSLALPPNVRVVLPPDLRDTEVRVEIRAGDVAALRSALESLERALGRAEIGEIFALLSEAP